MGVGSWSSASGECMMMRYLLVLLPVVVSCGDLTNPVRERRDLNAAVDLWVQQEPTAYRYTVLKSCFCASVRPIVVDVNNGVIVAARYADTGEPIEPANSEMAASISVLFDQVRKALDEGADHIDAEYDAARGFPTRIAIDWRRNVADDEVTWSVRGFTLLN
jgi:hypothetical protein